MGRHLLNLLTALSLLLCVAAVALWVRGYRVKDVLRWPTATGRAKLESNRGQFVLIVTRVADLDRGERPSAIHYQAERVSHYGAFNRHRTPRLTVHFERFGFESHTWHFDSPETWVRVPDYAVALATAILPLGWACRHGVRRRLYATSLCPACGYDLRATPGRCPECGRAVADG